VCLHSIATAARIRKTAAKTLELAHPLSVQFTKEQLDWIDSHRSLGLTRSAALRLIVEKAMRSGEQTIPSMQQRDKA